MATNNSNLLQNQKHLSEQLQLLNALGYLDLQMPCRGTLLDSQYLSSLRVLDTIAVALTTGEPGEAFAAAFDKRQGLAIILAKNGRVTDEDDQAVRDLFNTLTDPKTENASHVFPFLFSRCRDNIKKRVVRLGEAVDEFLPNLETVLKSYTPTSIDEELPRSSVYLQQTYSDDKPSFPEIMHNLVVDVKEKVQSLDLEDAEGSQVTFLRLSLVAFTLYQSRLLRSLCDDGDIQHAKKGRERAKRLKRRLAKVFHYSYGVQSLIRQAKRTFTNGIEYRWVRDVDSAGDTGGTEIYLDDLSEVLQRSLDHPLMDEILSEMREESPDLLDRSNTSEPLKIHLHAEIRIVLHLHSMLDDLDRREMQPIGCSKRSCLCCALWIDAYHRTFRTRYLTAESSGRAYANWALPGSLYTAALQGAWRTVDEAVLRGVEERLARTLAQLFQLPEKRVSDEFDEPWFKEREKERDEIFKMVFSAVKEDRIF